VIAKLGMFFLETFDEFQDGVLGRFHFILFLGVGSSDG
jgi:hypothetical protein